MSKSLNKLTLKKSEEIQYHLFVSQKIQRGIEDIEDGRIYSQEDIERRMGKWRVK